MKMKFYRLCLIALALILTGCGKDSGPDFFIVLDDTHGVQEKSKIIWRGAEAGEVSKIAPQEGKFRIEARLGDAYQGQVHAGVRGRAVNGITTKFKPVIELYGGTDASAPVLPRGARIEESNLLDRAREWSPWLIGCAVAAVIFFIVAKLMKGIFRFVALLASIALLAGSIWLLVQQWRAHKADIISPEVEAQLSELAEKTIHSPAAAAALEAVQRDISALIGKAGTSARDTAEKALDAKVAELRKSGQNTAAQELADLRAKLIAP